MDVDAYLDRIGYRGPRAPSAETLRDLHRAHLFSVPFENLDIALGRPIVLNEAALFDKIVRRRRGGFCYECNGLFAALLRELGFDVSLLSARVVDGDGVGPEFDHLMLLVRVGARREEWMHDASHHVAVPLLADVGFGDSFIEPMRLDDRGEQIQSSGIYQLTCEGDDWTLHERLDDGAWGPQAVFSLRPRALADFAGMCHFHQTSPESSFTRKRVCSMATPDGRVTLSGLRLIMTHNGQRTERELANEHEVQAVLRQQFGIEVSLS